MSEYLPGNLCERLRELREARNLDIYEVADIVGVSRTTYSRIESGIGSLSAEGLMKLAKFYDVPTDYILGMVDTPEKTYFEIKELGLSVEAAKNLYSGKIDPRILNELLINDKFAAAVRMMSLYFSSIMSDAIRTSNFLKDFNYSMLDELMQTGELPKDDDMNQLKFGLKASKDSPTQYEVDKIKNNIFAAVKEIKDKIDADANTRREERLLLDSKIANHIKMEMQKLKWGRTLPKKKLQSEMVDILKSGMELDPNMTPEILENITPGLKNFVENFDLYGKK